MKDDPQFSRADWKPLPVESLPSPTCHPAGMALATTLIFWGIITTWIISAVGLGLFAFTLAGWIRKIRHERNHR